MITDCEFKSCDLNNGLGGCVSTSEKKCKSIPSQFDPDYQAKQELGEEGFREMFGIKKTVLEKRDEFSIHLGEFNILYLNENALSRQGEDVLARTGRVDIGSFIISGRSLKEMFKRCGMVVFRPSKSFMERYPKTCPQYPIVLKSKF